MIKADTAPKEQRLQQPWKPITVRGQKRGSKDPSPILLCDMFPSPARPKGLVSVLTLQTLNIFTKHKGHNCLPPTSFLPGREIWILPKGHCQLKFQWLSKALLFDFFLGAKSTFRCKWSSLLNIMNSNWTTFYMSTLNCDGGSSKSNVNEENMHMLCSRTHPHLHRDCCFVCTCTGSIIFLLE